MSRTVTKKATMIGFTARGTSRERRAAIAERGEGMVRDLSQRVAPDDLCVGLEALERALEPQNALVADSAQANGALIEALTGGRAYDARARAELEFSNLQRAFERRRRLLEGALTATQVSALLGSKSRQTPHDRRAAGTLLAVQDNGAWKFPLWQFDPDGPDGVVAGLPAILRALSESGVTSPLQQAGFLLQPNPALGGRTALEALQAGATQDVIAIARGVGAS